MIVATLDSTVINHLGRKPKKGVHSEPLATVLDNYISDKRLHIAMDYDMGLIDEWCRTAGEEFVKNLVIAWNDLGGIYTVPQLGKIHHHKSKKLRELGMKHHTIDFLIVRIALGTPDPKVIVSDDSDFWDPKSKNLLRSVGSKNAPVAKYLKENLEITVYLLKQLLQRLEGGPVGNR